ncbi:MAG TPA: DUF4178 domain-containing protein [Bryobacteraceae bacterium]|nr:DUF4178 domain-containing protein [Bryobacteraceae bacterium]
MITTLLLTILGGLLLLVLWQLFRKPAATVNSAVPVSTTNPTVAVTLPQARPGDVISVHGAAADFSDIDFTVERKNRYESGPNSWIELTGDFRGQRVFLEVYPGREADIIGFFDASKPTLADIGVSEEQLALMDESQNPAAGFPWNGKQWQYESSREVGYFENEAGNGEGFYRWVFRDPASKALICVEKWEGDPFSVRVAQRLNSQDITIFRAA